MRMKEKSSLYVPSHSRSTSRLGFPQKVTACLTPFIPDSPLVPHRPVPGTKTNAQHTTAVHLAKTYVDRFPPRDHKHTSSATTTTTATTTTRKLPPHNDTDRSYPSPPLPSRDATAVDPVTRSVSGAPAVVVGRRSLFGILLVLLLARATACRYWYLVQQEYVPVRIELLKYHVCGICSFC